MHKRLMLNSIVAALVVLFAILPASAAQFAPTIFSIDQDVIDGTVTVTRVTSNGPGWVVIHADDNGAPGPVLGQTAVPSGITADVVVEVDLAGVTDTLWAMLHVDEGEAGVYEFPGADGPVQVNDAIVMDPFVIGEIADSIAGIAASTDGFSVLVQALDAAGLVSTLQSDGPFTVFAPTDDAFAAVPAETLDALLADTDALTEVLLYHVVPGAVMAGDITDGMEAETVQGSPLVFTIDGDMVMVNEATVTSADITAYNGVIHVIDTVLMPPAPEEEVVEAAATEEEAAEEDTVSPSVAVSDQDSDGTTISVDNVVAAQDGWMVIHSDDSGAPGPVLGQSAVAAGESTDVVVTLDEALTESATVWAMLHVDEGEAGVYEFPGPDGPVLVDDQIVMAPLMVTVAAMEAAEMAETEVMTDTEMMASETMTDTEMMASETMTDTEMMASDTMTDTEMMASDTMTDTEMMASDTMTDTEMMDSAAMSDTPSVTVIDQGSNGTNVAVIQAIATQAGWMVIHADNNDAPGAVIGKASLPAGTTDNIIVTLDEPISGEVKLWAMLHVDEGEAGVYEFPGPDGPVTVDDTIVMQQFTAIVTDSGMAEETMAEATPEPTEEAMAEETMAEATPEPTEEAMAEETMAEETMTDDAMGAPDMLPQTGFATTSSTTHLPVVFLVITMLFGAAVLTRRRQ